MFRSGYVTQNFDPAVHRPRKIPLGEGAWGNSNAVGEHGRGSRMETTVPRDRAVATPDAGHPLASWRVPVLLPVRTPPAGAAPGLGHGLAARGDDHARRRCMPRRLAGPPVAAAVAALRQDGILPGL